MRFIFSTSSNLLLNSIWLFLLRLGAGAAMLTHGLPKLEMLMGGNAMQFGDPLGIGTTASLICTVIAEVLCSALLIVGLGTRIAAAGLAFTMAVAVFLVHGHDPFQKKELGLLYLLIYLTLLALGAGRFSVDQLIGKKRDKGW